MPAPLRAETIPRRLGIGPAVHLATLEADLAREKAERAADADRLGEMLLRVAAVEAERRSIAIQLLASSERARSLEAELERVHEDIDEHRARALVAIRAREAEARHVRDETQTALAETVSRLRAAELARDRALEEADARTREVTALHARLVGAENEVSRMALSLEAAEVAAADELERNAALEVQLAAARDVHAPERGASRRASAAVVPVDGGEIPRVRAEAARALEAIQAALRVTEQALGRVLDRAASHAEPRGDVDPDPTEALTRRPNAAATAFMQGGIASRASRSSRPTGAARTKPGSDAPRSRPRPP